MAMFKKNTQIWWLFCLQFSMIIMDIDHGNFMMKNQCDRAPNSLSNDTQLDPILLIFISYTNKPPNLGVFFEHRQMYSVVGL